MIITLQSYVRQGRHTLRKWAADPRVQLGARLLAYVLAGFGLSAASLNHLAQPLALGLVCALSGWAAVLAAIGGALGYMVFWGAAGYQGILWLGAGLAAALFLSDKRLLGDTPLLRPAVAGFIVAAAGVAAQIWLRDSVPVPMYLLRALLAAGSVWVFERVIKGRNPILEWITGGLGVLALAQIAPIPYLGFGYIAAGVLGVYGAFPAAALAGLALDLGEVTKVSMTAVLCGAYLVRFLPQYSRWLGGLAPGLTYVLVMSLTGNFDLTPLPGLVLGGIGATFLPPQTKLAHRRGETGVAQVRLEVAAGVLAQTEQLLLETQPPPVDEDALVARAADRACSGCSCRKYCKDSRRLSQLSATLLHKPLLTPQELPIVCRKSGRFLAELHRSQEQLSSIHADRERQREYRAAVVQQYGFLSTYLQDLSDQLSQRAERSRPAFTPYTRVYGNQPRANNGDRCIMFPGTRCKYYVLLCDGMGTGIGAVQEGRAAANLLRRLLTAGYPAEHALHSFNSLCALRDRAGSVTVDLAELELDSGTVTLYKWGAAPSYLVTRLGVDKVGKNSPPPGLAVTEDRQVVEKLSLRRGELLVMVSDGLGEDEVMRCCQTMGSTAPTELGAALLTGSRVGAADDATVVLVKLDPGYTVVG